MPIPGERIGPYEIIEPIGKGGMGEVWKARDPRLGRDVAIKFSGAAFTERFEREARVVASLNHPNICHLYDVGPDYLVMELIDGETLAERIAQGPIPLDEALELARQIGEALEAAHEKGITHRDLKPGNIKIRPDGMVKVLDFGLAKVGGTPSVQSTDSPTITMGATQAGMILGTAAYMAPEQAKGKPVDKRADIWAFGVVLYEMITAKPLFAGDNVTDILAAVVTAEPDLSGVPRRVRRLITACLEKKVAQRLQSIGDWRLALDEPASAPQTAPVRASKLAWGIAAGLGVMVIAGAAFWLTRTVPAPKIILFELFPPEGSTLALGTPAPAPDGQSIAYSVMDGTGMPRIYVRRLESAEARMVPGTEGAVHPFWSPDGRSLGFTDARGGRTVKVIHLAGGPAIALTPVGGPWHGTWNQTGTVLVLMEKGIGQAPDTGGAVTVLPNGDKGDAQRPLYPEFLSDGKRYLVTVPVSADGKSNIELASLGSTQRSVVIPNIESAALVAPTPAGKSYLLFARDSSLLAQEFDETSGTAKGEAVLVANNVGKVGTPSIRPAVGVSSNVLAYQNAVEAAEKQFTWVDRAGKQLSETSSNVSGNTAILSPDARFAALRKRSSLWVSELARGTSALFASDSYGAPVWSPDGTRIAYRVENGYVRAIFAKASDGSGQPELLYSGDWLPVAWLPDGKTLLIQKAMEAVLALLPLSGDRTPVPLDGPPCFAGDVSQDGRFLACTSVEGGRSQVFIRALPPTTGRWQVSIDGGGTPQWRGDGKEIYFVAGDTLMAADIKLDATPTMGVPHALFSSASSGFLISGYEVSPDGKRFLVSPRPTRPANYPITVVLNWWAALQEKGK